METLAVMDFETNGGSVDQGGRATEIAIILLQNGQVVDRYQSLMKTGAYIPSFIEELTGISNEMCDAAPHAEKVMQEAYEFVGRAPLVAHNAAFDSKVWDAEIKRLGYRRTEEQRFICTLLLARRLLPHQESYKLGHLARVLGIRSNGRAHRAMVDTEMAASLMSNLVQRVEKEHQIINPSHLFFERLQKIKKESIRDKIQGVAKEVGLNGAPGAYLGSMTHRS